MDKNNGPYYSPFEFFMDNMGYFKDFIGRIGVASDQIDDILQDSAISIQQAEKSGSQVKCESEKQCRAYCKVVVRNRAYDHWRKSRTRLEESLLAHELSAKSSKPDPEKIILIIEAYLESELEPEEAQVIYDLFIDSQSITEVSHHRRMSRSAVYRLVDRVLSRLSNYLKNLRSLDPDLDQSLTKMGL